MKNIDFDSELHQAGERTVVASHSLRQACAWWVAAELVRRHPDDLYVIEQHPKQYDCVAVMCRGNDRIPGPYALVHMNKQPGAHLTPNNWNGERFNWLEVLLAEDRLNYVVRQLEQLHDLPAPATTPPTVRRSIGPRLIAGFLQRTALGPRSWIALNGMLDSEYGAEVRQELFESIPGMSTAATRKEPGDVDGRAAYRYWLLGPGTGTDDVVQSLPPDQVAFGVDTWLGHVWNGSGKRIDLMTSYDSVGRKMDALISKVCPPAF